MLMFKLETISTRKEHPCDLKASDHHYMDTWN